MRSINPTLAWWKRFIRVIRHKFEDDAYNLKAVRYAFRMETLEHKDETEPEKIAKLILDGETAREWFLNDMIRANLQDSGQYKLKITHQHYDSS
jgi:hypothetical protein